MSHTVEEIYFISWMIIFQPQFICILSGWDCEGLLCGCGRSSREGQGPRREDHGHGHGHEVRGTRTWGEGDRTWGVRDMDMRWGDRTWGEGDRTWTWGEGDIDMRWGWQDKPEPTLLILTLKVLFIKFLRLMMNFEPRDGAEANKDFKNLES